MPNDLPGVLALAALTLLAALQLYGGLLYRDRMFPLAEFIGDVPMTSLQFGVGAAVFSLALGVALYFASRPEVSPWLWGIACAFALVVSLALAFALFRFTGPPLSDTPSAEEPAPSDAGHH